MSPQLLGMITFEVSSGEGGGVAEGPEDTSKMISFQNHTGCADTYGRSLAFAVPASSGATWRILQIASGLMKISLTSVVSSHRWRQERPAAGVVLKTLVTVARLLFRGAQVRPRGLSRYAEVLKCNVVVAGYVLCSYVLGLSCRSFLTVARLHFPMPVDPVSPPS